MITLGPSADAVASLIVPGTGTRIKVEIPLTATPDASALTQKALF